jgi:DNA-binding ferritin-like protein
MHAAANTPLTRALLNAWAALHGEYWLLWTLHWRSKGGDYYGDHLLYQRLYEARQPELDRMAEVIAAVGGASALDPVKGLDAAKPLVAQVEALNKPDAAKAIVAAQTVMRAMDAAAQAAQGTPYRLAVENATGGIADSHLEAVYLLQQRLAGGPMPPPRGPSTYRPYGMPAMPVVGPHASYEARSDAGRTMASALRFAAGGSEVPTGTLDVPTVLGAAGDLLSLVPGSQARDTAETIGKGLAIGAGLVAAHAVWRHVKGR